MIETRNRRRSCLTLYFRNESGTPYNLAEGLPRVRMKSVKRQYLTNTRKNCLGCNDTEDGKLFIYTVTNKTAEREWELNLEERGGEQSHKV